MRGLAALLLTGVAALCCAQPTPDPRVVVDRLSSDFRRFNAVGIVFPVTRADEKGVRTFGRGSGALISPCHLLTNYHVATEANRREVLFAVGQPAGDPAGFVYRLPGVVIDAGQFWDQRDFVDDWALVRLADPKTGRSYNVGERVGYFHFAAVTPAVLIDQPVIAAGYPDKQTNGLMAHVGCRLKRIDSDRFWRMACSITPGQSGGPVTFRTADYGDVLVAMNAAMPAGASGIVAASETRLSRLTVAAPISRAAEARIRAAMAADRCN